MAERISKEAFWELVKFKYPTHQIVFCTRESITDYQIRRELFAMTNEIFSGRTNIRE